MFRDLRSLGVATLSVFVLFGCQQTESPGTDSGEAGATVASPAQASGGALNPNIIVVVVDDLRWDEFGASGHPYVETPNIDRLASEGALFENSFHAVPLCSPNRASILTGQYPSRHGIIDNVARNLASQFLETYPQALQEHGYRTAFLGKWHMGNDPTPRPGFDYWVGLPGQGRTGDPELFEDGELRVVEGYVTDILSDRAVSFIEQDDDRPFLIHLAHKAIHPDVRQLDDGSASGGLGYLPAPRHRGLYEDEVFERRPNVVATLADLDDKPAIRRALAYRATGDVTRDFGGLDAPQTSEETIRRRAEMLLSVDEGLGRVIESLEREGVLDETVIVFTSDNGFFFGEHGLTSERRLPYEESIRNPLLIRYPPVIEDGARPTGIATSVDIAPTLLDLAGATIGDHIQGRSLVPLLRGETGDWRESILVEFYTFENPFNHLVDMDYRAVRTDRYKYIRWVKHPDLDELYDLQADPFEMENLIDDPAMRGAKAELQAELGRLTLEAMGLASGNERTGGN